MASYSSSVAAEGGAIADCDDSGGVAVAWAEEQAPQLQPLRP